MAIASDWPKAIGLFERIADTEDRKYVDGVAEMFMKLSESEREAMEKLSKI